MTAVNAEQIKGIRSFLTEKGLVDPKWQDEVASLLARDIQLLMMKGSPFEEAKNQILGGLDPDKLVVLKLNHPFDRWHLIYKYLVTAFTIAAVAMFIAATVFVIIGSPLGFLLILSALGTFVFFVIPFRMLYRTRMERMERIYYNLFKR